MAPSELLRGTVKAVIEFVESGSRSFTFRQEGDIKRYMNGQPDKDKAADEVFNASRPFLKADECERVKGNPSVPIHDIMSLASTSNYSDFFVGSDYFTRVKLNHIVH